MTASKIITPEKEREILAHLQNTEYNFAIVDRQKRRSKQRLWPRISKFDSGFWI